MVKLLSFTRINECICVTLVTAGMLMGYVGLAHGAEADDDVLAVASSDNMLSPDELASRGGQQEMQLTQTLTSEANGNTLNVTGDLRSGDIVIGDNFGSGLGSYVFNTGNNTSITSAVSVSMQTTSAAP